MRNRKQRRADQAMRRYQEGLVAAHGPAPGMTPHELAALPIIGNPTMVDQGGNPSLRVERMKLGNTGGYALVCHPDRVQEVQEALARDVARAEGKLQ